MPLLLLMNLSFLNGLLKRSLLTLDLGIRLLKYRLQKTKSTLSDIVQINGKHMPTGLVREGGL